MTYKSIGPALALLSGLTFAACGGSTTIEFVGDPDNTGGNDGDGGGDGDGGSDGDGGGNLGGMGGDGTGGSTPGSGGGPIVLGYCGDGIIDTDDEDCDDENERSGDGCSSACEIETPFVCSGEPSVCSLFGNGQVDPGEECDDGNDDDGDGCSSTGDVEGSCEDPAVLTLVPDGFGTSEVAVTADTSAGGASSPAQACAGLPLGAAPDRAYFIEVADQGDLTITLDAEFDAFMRIYGSYAGSACEPDMEAFCIDDAGAGEPERFHFREVGGGGGIVIVVDGAEPGEEGEFTLTVTLGCDADHVKLHRLTPFNSGGKTAVLSLRNTSDYCTVNLDSVGLVATDDYGLVPVDLPAQGLGPRELFRGSFDVVPSVNPNAFDFAEVPGPFDSSAAGAYLCDGACDLTNGSNVTDAVLTGTIPNAQVPGTTFSPAHLQGVLTSPFQAYVRVAYDGVAPNFVAADWSPAFLVDPDDYALTDFEIYDDAAYPYPLVAPTVETDPQEGSVVSFPVPAGSFASSAYVGHLPAAVENATYVSYKVRTGSQGTYGCYTNLGIDNGSIGSSGGWSGSGLYSMSLQFRYWLSGGASVGWYVYPVQQVPGDTTMWHTVELTNIDWTNHTYDAYYDGNLIGTAVPMSDSTINTVTKFSLVPYYPVDCHYSDIVVRNGPPGRIWESPPVLIAPD